MSDLWKERIQVLLLIAAILIGWRILGHRNINPFNVKVVYQRF